MFNVRNFPCNEKSKLLIAMQLVRIQQKSLGDPLSFLILRFSMNNLSVFSKFSNLSCYKIKEILKIVLIILQIEDQYCPSKSTCPFKDNETNFKEDIILSVHFECW